MLRPARRLQPAEVSSPTGSPSMQSGSPPQAQAASSSSSTVTSRLRGGFAGALAQGLLADERIGLSSLTANIVPASNGVSSGPSSAPQARRPASIRRASSA